MLQEDCASRHMLRLPEEQYRKYSASVVEFLDAVYDWAEMNYEKGQWIVETFTPDEILQSFRTLGEVRRTCKMLREKQREIENA